jgi:hypothetical protein
VLCPDFHEYSNAILPAEIYFSLMGSGFSSVKLAATANFWLNARRF